MDTRQLLEHNLGKFNTFLKECDKTISADVVLTGDEINQYRFMAFTLNVLHVDVEIVESGLEACRQSMQILSSQYNELSITELLMLKFYISRIELSKLEMEQRHAHVYHLDIPDTLAKRFAQLEKEMTAAWKIYTF
jgi:hypothetical protein